MYTCQETNVAINSLHNLVQHWEKLFYPTGGAINFQKSVWFIMAWWWKNGWATTTNNLLVESALTEG